MSVPLNRDELCNRWENGERFPFLFFYGHTPPETGVNQSCFSQWFARPFTVDGIIYPTAEHWMMAGKARLFGDEEMLAEILQADTPKEVKALGRRVKNFDPLKWDEKKFEIVEQGNYHKFTQHADLKKYLLGTSSLIGTSEDSINTADSVKEKPVEYRSGEAGTLSDVISVKTNSGKVILVEAAGRDVVWGIGLGQNNPKAQDPLQWRGRNMLGFALTAVRERMARE